MFFVKRSLVLFVLCGVALLGATSCSTSGSQTKHEGSEKPQTSKTAPAPDIDPDVARYLLAQNAPVVVKLDIERFDEQISPIIEPLLNSPIAPRGAKAAFAMFGERGLTAVALGAFNTPKDAEQVDRSRPAYMSARVLADPSYWTALRYGAVFHPKAVSPQALHLRVLLPVDNPDALVAKMRTKYDSADHKMAVTAGDRFVVVDLLYPREGANDEALGTWAAAKAEKAAPARMTPALARFASTKAPVAAYLRSDLVRLHSAGMGMYEALEAFEVASPKYRQQMLARGGALGLNVLMLTPGAEREQEDTLIELRADDAKGLVLDLTSTLTARGREVAAVAAEAHTLTKVPTADAQSLARVATLSWNYDLAAARNEVPVQFDEKGDSLLENPGGLSEAFRTGGIWSYVTLLTSSPFLVPRAFATMLSDAQSAGLPVAGHLDVTLPASKKVKAPADVGVLGAARLASDQAEPALSTLFSRFRRLYGAEGYRAKMDMQNAEGASTLRVQLGPQAKTGTKKKVALAPGALKGWVDLAALVTSAEGPEVASQLGPFSQMRVEMKLDGDVSRLRLHFGSGELAVPEVPKLTGFEPLERGHGCIDKLAQDSTAVFEAFAQMSPNQSVEGMLRFAGFYDKGADACAKVQPELADEIELAKARMRQLALLRLSFVDRPEAEAEVRKAACEMGDKAQCAALEAAK